MTPKSVDQVVKIAAVTRSAVMRRRSPEVLQEGFVRQVRIERIKQAQEEEKSIAKLKEFLIGDITKVSIEEAKLCARIAFEYEVDESGLLFQLEINGRSRESRGFSLFGGTGTTAAKLPTSLLYKDGARLPTSLPYKSGGRKARYRQNITTNPVQVLLERTRSEFPAFCERTC